MAFAIGTALNTGFIVIEAIYGILAGSMALLADAGHMLTDILGLTMALVAIRFAQRPATPSKTYGFFRTEILAALGNSVVLLGIAAFIMYEAWDRFRSPLEVQSLPMLAIAVGGLIVNVIGVWLLRAGAQESLNVQGAFLELVSDLLGSLGVIIAASVIFFTGWTPVDAIASSTPASTSSRRTVSTAPRTGGSLPLRGCRSGR